MGAKLSADRGRGFILTAEYIIITTIIVLSLWVGWAAVRGRLIALFRRSVVVMVDSAAPPKVFGWVNGYDAFAAPQVARRDITAPPNRNAVMVAVAQNGFTTPSHVYYDGPGCAGTAHLKTGEYTLGEMQNPGYVYAAAGGWAVFRAPLTGAPVVPILLSNWSRRTTYGTDGTGTCTNLGTPAVTFLKAEATDIGPFTAPVKVQDL